MPISLWHKIYCGLYQLLVFCTVSPTHININCYRDFLMACWHSFVLLKFLCACFTSVCFSLTLCTRWDGQPHWWPWEEHCWPYDTSRCRWQVIGSSPWQPSSLQCDIWIYHMVQYVNSCVWFWKVDLSNT